MVTRSQLYHICYEYYERVGDYWDWSEFLAIDTNIDVVIEGDGSDDFFAGKITDTTEWLYDSDAFRNVVVTYCGVV